MDRNELSNFYDDLKDRMVKPEDHGDMLKVGKTIDSPGAMVFRRKACHEADKLKDACCKHLLLDIYCKIIPLDDDYVASHRGQMMSDVNGMLGSKGINGIQYLKGAYEKTKAPLLEYVLRYIDDVGQRFMEEANDTLKDAQENDIDVPAPEADTSDDNTGSQIVDIQSDMEYETFVDALKKKTIDKIVTDISRIINNEKEVDDMTFKSTPESPADTEEKIESTTSVGLQYIQSKLMKESVNITEDIHNNMIGMAIRESTLNQIDKVFNQDGNDFRSFSTRIRLGKGAVINESAINYLKD